MPQLLSDDITLTWRRNMPLDDAIALLAHVNRAAAEGLKRPIELVPLAHHGQVHGVHVFLLGRPWISARFLEPQDVETSTPYWILNLLQAPAYVRHEGISPSDRLGSLDNLLIDMWEANLATLDYVAWSFGVIRELVNDIKVVSVEPLVRALEAHLPATALRARFREALVGTDLASLMDALKASKNFRQLADVALRDVDQATQLWRAVHDNHLRGLLPLLVQALPFVPFEGSALKFLRHLGIGRGLARRLSQVPPASLEGLADVCEQFLDTNFTRLVMHRLTPVMARMEVAAEELDCHKLRLDAVFQLCQRLAILDQHLACGRTHLPRRQANRLEMDRPVIDAQTHLAATESDAHPTPISALCNTLEAALKAMLAAPSMMQIQRINSRLAHVLDWLGAEGGLAGEIPAGVSLDRLHERADAWALNLHLKELPDWRWECAVHSHAKLWAELESCFEGGFHVQPLTTPAMLAQEGHALGHCAGAYAERCASGNTRIFSIQQTGKSFATVELAYREDHLWQIVQCKGKHNEELLQPSLQERTPLAEVLQRLIAFYNVHAPQDFPNVLPSNNEAHTGAPFELTPEFLAEARARLPFIGNFLREMENR